jgi:uncharacterized protein (UPF0335 family)
MENDDQNAKKLNKLGIGHNAAEIAFNNKIKGFIDEILLLTVDLDKIKGDIKAIYARAKGADLDTKALRRLVKIKQIIDDDKLETLKEDRDTFDKYALAYGLKSEQLELF